MPIRRCHTRLFALGLHRDQAGSVLLENASATYGNNIDSHCRTVIAGHRIALIQGTHARGVHDRAANRARVHRRRDVQRRGLSVGQWPHRPDTGCTVIERARSRRVITCEC